MLLIENELKKKFQLIEDNFNKAIVSNNVTEIKKCISDDWSIVDAQGGILPNEKFLDEVESGILSHSEMTIEIAVVKVYGDIAVVIGRGKNKGMWQGKPIEADEWVTDIFKLEKDKWICVMTHLVPVK